MKTERESNTQRILWIIIFSISLFLSVKQRDYFQLGVYKDDASYVLLAESIINSHQFGSVPGLDSSVLSDFPFGFPLLLVPLLIIFQDNYNSLSIISLIATLLNVAILFWGWRWLVPRSSAWWGLAISGLYASFPLVIRHTSMVMSEPIFTTLCLLSIILIEYSVRQNKTQNAYYVLTGVLLAMCFFIRTIGIALIISVILYLILKYKIIAWKPMMFLLVGMIIISVTIILLTPISISNIIPKRYIHNDLVRITTTRLNNILDSEMSTKVIPGNIDENSTSDAYSRDPWIFVFGGLKWHLEEDVRDVVLPAGGGDFEENIFARIGLAELPRALGLIVSIIILFGTVIFFKKYGSNLFLFYTATYFLILTFWVWEGSRLLYPIQPQFQFAFLFGLQTILIALLTKFWNKSVSQKYTKGFLVSLVLLMMSISIYKGYTLEHSSNHAGDLQARTEWLGKNTKPDAVILSGEPVTDYLYLQRNMIRLPNQIHSGSEFADYLHATSVNYILVAPEIGWQPIYQPEYDEIMVTVLPYINQLAAEHWISLVYQDETNFIRVYQVNPEVWQGKIE